VAKKDKKRKNNKETILAVKSDSQYRTIEAGSGKPKKKSRLKKCFAAAFFCGVLALGVLAAYDYHRHAMYYQTHFFPNTSINGVDCSDMEIEPVIAMLDTWIDDYTLEVTGRDYKTGESGAVLGRILPDDIQLSFAGTREAVESYMNQQEVYKWIFNEGASYSLKQDIMFDEGMLAETVRNWEACREENMLKAEDAYISDYSESDNRYDIIAETVGTELDVNKVIGLVNAAVSQRETVLDIESQDCYKTAAVLHDDEKLVNIVDTVNKWLGTSITYDWNGTEVKLDYRILKDWITLEKDGPVLNEEEVVKFVKKQAALYDTYGKKRNFITALNVELTLPSGYYGWKTDVESESEALIQLIYQGSVDKKEPVYSSTAKKKGMSDIGNSYVEADLTHQHLYLYQNGKVVLETDFVSGSMSSTPDCATPPGVFGLAYKTTNAVLRGANYRTPVNYWMPFYGNYGMHDATWRSEFGGDIYIAGGSHGCINLPLDMAAQIYQYVSTGFPVICYYYEVDPLAGQDEENESSEEGEEEDWEDDESQEDWGDDGDQNDWEDDGNQEDWEDNGDQDNWEDN